MVETHEEDQEPPAGEHAPANSGTTPLELGSVGETPGPNNMQTSAVELGMTVQASETKEQSQPNPLVCVDSATKLQQMLQGSFASIRSELSAHQERVKSGLNSVKLDLQSNQEKLEIFQEKVRGDIKSETQKLLQTFEAQTQGLRKKFNSKVESETRRTSQLVSQVQSETTTELVAVKQQLQDIGAEFDSRLCSRT
jgi:hypothetical protein